MTCLWFFDIVVPRFWNFGLQSDSDFGSKRVDGTLGEIQSQRSRHFIFVCLVVDGSDVIRRR